MKNQKTKILSWKPKRKGKVFCAPACGRGCLYSEYLFVKKEAKELSKFLKDKVGGKWKVHIWENLGWYSSLHCGTISVHPRFSLMESPSYLVMNSGDGKFPGSGHAGLGSYSAADKDSIPSVIVASLNDHKKMVTKYIDAYHKNKEFKKFQLI